MFTKAERFPVKKTPESSNKERRQKEAQPTDRALRLHRRNRSKEIRERLERYHRRRSWLKPFLRACKHVQSLPLETRRVSFKTYLPFTELPKALSTEGLGRSLTLTSPFLRYNRTESIKNEESTQSVIIGTGERIDEFNQGNVEEEIESVFTPNSTIRNIFGEGSSDSAVQGST